MAAFKEVMKESKGEVRKAKEVLKSQNKSGMTTKTTYNTRSGERFTNLGSNTHQGDYRFFNVLERLGAVVTRDQTSTLISGPSQLAHFKSIDMQENKQGLSQINRNAQKQAGA